MKVLLVYSVFSVLLFVNIYAQYTGTGTITRGQGTMLQPNIFQCSGGRSAVVGKSIASDGSTWIVPADTRFNDAGLEYASDLYNSCSGKLYPSASVALAALDGKDIRIIDDNGELLTAYIFSDNYFELYVKGVAVAKDPVPYTPFNSCLVRFRVRAPFSLAMKIVDWEEHPGLGTENANGSSYHPGDGGLVVVVCDTSQRIIAVSDHRWRAQTFYTAPINDLSCLREDGALRRSELCSTSDLKDGSQSYAVHWTLPSKWMDESYDDSMWPAATEYSNSVVGVDNKPAYTTFTNIFDNPVRDASFIWSSNLVLDNLVLVRARIDNATDPVESNLESSACILRPNPAHDQFILGPHSTQSGKRFDWIRIVNSLGQIVYEALIDEDNECSTITIPNWPPGVYHVFAHRSEDWVHQKLIVQ